MIVGFIGDIHGRDNWKSFINTSAIEHWVFVGDYCDSYDLSNVEIIANLNEIIEFKKSKPDTVTLLIGNHDLQYIHPQSSDRLFSCSGFRPEAHFDLHEIFRNNKELFQTAWQYGNVIATHAGIQHNWFVNRFKGNLEVNIADQLNNPENKEQYLSLYEVGHLRGGYQDAGGPMWCDRNELKKPLKGYTQVVGHTPVKKDIMTYHYQGDMVWFVDCIVLNKFLTLNI